MSKLTKGDLLNRSFGKLRISGKTKIVQGGEMDDALADLESFCAELDGTGYVTGYNYEEFPDSGTETGLDSSLHKAFVKVMAVELMPDYGKGKDPDPLLMKQALGGLSVIHRITKQRRTSHLPATFPIGKHATFPIGKHARSRWSNVSRKFYPERANVPFVPSPYLIYEGDISPQQEDMGQWLQPLDDVDSYTIDSTTGLQINSTRGHGPMVAAA